MFPRSFTVQGFVPSAAETDRVLLTTHAHPVLLTLRLPAFLFLCHIHLGSGCGPGEPSVMQKLTHTQRQYTHKRAFMLQSLVLHKPQLIVDTLWCTCLTCVGLTC